MKQQLNLKYNGDFSDVVSIPDLEKQMFINAICFTKSITQAALEVGVSERTMITFCAKHNLTQKVTKQMRLEFKASGIKVKKRFNYES